MIVISGTDAIDLAQYDEVWYITNNVPNMKQGAVQHKELAPFIGSYMKYRRGQMSSGELLNDYSQALWSGKYKEAIDNLLELSNSGKWIQLVCYCKDYSKCHRSVLARYLKTFDIDVVVLDED